MIQKEKRNEKKLIEDSIEKAEKEIKKTLQAFHDETGLNPVSIVFHSIDISTYDAEIRKEIKISSVHLQANTYREVNNGNGELHKKDTEKSNHKI